jgi:hypothetical protein
MPLVSASPMLPSKMCCPLLLQLPLPRPPLAAPPPPPTSSQRPCLKLWPLAASRHLPQHKRRRSWLPRTATTFRSVCSSAALCLAEHAPAGASSCQGLHSLTQTQPNARCMPPCRPWPPRSPAPQSPAPPAMPLPPPLPSRRPLFSPHPRASLRALPSHRHRWVRPGQGWGCSVLCEQACLGSGAARLLGGLNGCAGAWQQLTSLIWLVCRPLLWPSQRGRQRA